MKDKFKNWTTSVVNFFLEDTLRVTSVPHKGPAAMPQIVRGNMNDILYRASIELIDNPDMKFVVVTKDPDESSY